MNRQKRQQHDTERHRGGAGEASAHFGDALLAGGCSTTLPLPFLDLSTALPWLSTALPRPVHCPSLAVHCLSSTIHCISLTVHCLCSAILSLFTAFPSFPRLFTAFPRLFTTFPRLPTSFPRLLYFAFPRLPTAFPRQGSGQFSRRLFRFAAALADLEPSLPWAEAAAVLPAELVGVCVQPFA